MRATTRVLVTLATASAIASLPLVAQDAPRTRGFGLTAGVLSSSISDLDFADEFTSASTGRRIGFQIGAFAERSLGDRLSVRPEVLYIQKGAKADIRETGVDGTDGTIDLTLGYVELPLLLRARLGATSGTGARPYLEVGPTFAFRTQCEASAEADGISVSFDCDEFGDAGSDGLRRFDAGLALGGGIAFRLGTRDASFGLRYTQALTTLSDEGDASPRNNVIAGVFSIALR